MEAGHVYEIAVVPHRRRWSRPLRVIGSLVLGALTSESPRLSVGDYVVRRRVDGREVLRIDGDTEGESTTYDHLRGQLDAMSEAEFCETWGIAG